MQICKMFVHKDRFSTGFVSTFVSYPGSCLNMFVIALLSCVVTEKHGEGACKATARSARFQLILCVSQRQNVAKTQESNACIYLQSRKIRLFVLETAHSNFCRNCHVAAAKPAVG